MIATLPRVPLFTLNPPHGAGRRARKGYEFQDRYAAYVLSGFGAGRDELIAARLEAVEDIDTLVMVDGSLVERYYQVKSKDEGTGNWTLRQLETSGVLQRFFSLYKEFEQKKREQNRTIELAFSAEGDLDNELSELKARGWESTESRNALFASLCMGEQLSSPGGAQFQDQGAQVQSRKLYKAAAPNFLESEHPLSRLSTEQPETFEGLVARSGRPVQEVIEELDRAADQVVRFFRGFLASLRLESRLGSLENLTHARLLERRDLSPDEARKAADCLLQAIRDESLLPEPTEISPSTLSGWLGSPERELLQPKPELAADAVQRTELLHEIGNILEAQPALVLYGLPKVGKSQLVSTLIDVSAKVSDYFWFTFSGERGDTERLLRQLATWCGKRGGVWQPKDDVHAGLLQPAQAIARLGKIPLHGTWIILDDCHKLEDSSTLTLLRTLTDAWPESRLILASEEKLPDACLSSKPHPRPKTCAFRG
jgi:hypothetical protein